MSQMFAVQLEIYWEKNGMTGKSKKFTILELLLVIAVIVILMSMLFPMLKQAKDKAREIKCSGNLKQIIFAYNMYVNDNNEFLTSYGTGAYLRLLLPYIDSNFVWLTPFYEHYGENMIYHCLSATAEDSWAASLYSFGQNEHLNSGEHSNSLWFLQKISRISSPGNIFVFTDTARPSVYDLTYFSFRHANGINIIYMDAHCSYSKYLYAQENCQPSNYRFWYGRSSL